MPINSEREGFSCQNIAKRQLVTAGAVAKMIDALLLAPVGGWQLVTGGWHLGWWGWVLTVYMGAIVTGLAMFLNMEGIKRIGSGKAAIFGNLMPIFGVLFSILLLGEHMFWYHWVGFSLTLLGIVLSVVRLPEQVVVQEN